MSPLNSRVRPWLRRSRQAAPRCRSGSFRPHLETLEARDCPAIAYHGGGILPNVQVEAIYYGSAWNTESQMIQERQHLDAFLKDIVNSPYMDALKEYYENSLGTVFVGRGSFVGSQVVNAYFNTDQYGTQMVDDGAVQAMLSQQIRAGKISYGYDYLPIVFTPDNVVWVNQGAYDSTNYEQELAHHTYYSDPVAGDTPYALVPNPSGNPYRAHYWQATTTDLQRLTGTVSHELAEAVTDPHLDAWYDASPPTTKGPYGQLAPTGTLEIGDAVQYYEPSDYNFGPNDQFSILNGYAVQNVWSVKAGGTLTLPQTPADLTGATFAFGNTYYGTSAGKLTILSEDPTTGSFSGTFTNGVFGWSIWVSGQISNSTTATSGTVSSSIWFSGGGWIGPYLETTSFQGRVTGNGNGALNRTDVMNGSMTDFVYWDYQGSLYNVYGYAGSPLAYDQ